jgi:hypothetical protein
MTIKERERVTIDDGRCRAMKKESLWMTRSSEKEASHIFNLFSLLSIDLEDRRL